MVAISFDYFRDGRRMSLRRKVILSATLGAPSLPRFCFCGKGGIPRINILFILAILFALPLWSQYPGQVTKNTKDSPELRSIAVLEWTGEVGKPKTSRLVPVAVLDQTRILANQLQDGGIYMARPEPLALTGEVEYELQQDGKPIGLFDLKNSGQEQGSWVGYGAWKPLPAPKPKPSMDEVARNHADEDSDRPTLHRKHSSDGSETPSSTGGSRSTEPAPSPDPDRPTLHKKTSSDGTGNESSGSSEPSDDPDRPVLTKSNKKPPEDLGHVDSLPDVTDPDRPRLKRGQSTGSGLDVLPSLMGLPPDMEQTIAVSDARSRPEHQWTFSWANPDDEGKMKATLEEMARQALGLNPPPAPKRTAAQHSTHKTAKPAPPPEPASLVDEHFRVLELAYGSGATLVLSAHTDGPLPKEKFVTIIAQPDLYGNVLVLLKSVTDGAHLDDAPCMRLVDAVDALADNRGELLFELRGATQRQFALYRVLRGQAERLFVTGAGAFGAESRNQ